MPPDPRTPLGFLAAFVRALYLAPREITLSAALGIERRAHLAAREALGHSQDRERALYIENRNLRQVRDHQGLRLEVMDAQYDRLTTSYGALAADLAAARARVAELESPVPS